MKILVIDNYDSFTYNLVQMLGKFKNDLIIKRNDEITSDEISELDPAKILISPGPGRPEDSKISLNAIKDFGKNIPVLGVCLGHQAIGVIYGGKVIKAPVLMHGKVSEIMHDNKSIFKNVPQNFIATRYHSLIVEKKSVPDELEISAETSDGIIMGLRHKQYPVEGIQFHPESILTYEGETIIENWLAL
jgi:anthranilate synthase component II